MVNLINNSPMGLMDALCKRISAVLSDSFWHQSEFSEGEYHTPHVHAQNLPVSLTRDVERDMSKDFPLVKVVCVDGEITDFAETTNASEIMFRIYFGGYYTNKDNQGWRIPLAMLWRVLQDLLANTITEGYQLDVPVTWTPISDD